ncbi:transglycosylase-like protein with SLT domain [Novosphingobium sp. PhB55]|nr:transglycosylase-like protein with SLT domain [Novosphingobium sp. PhB55]
MGALRHRNGAAAAIVSIFFAAPLHADEVGRWTAHMTEASVRFGVPESWIRQVIRAESRGRTKMGGRPIRSPKGAIGLMQLMPGTWAEMRGKLGLGKDPDNPRDNILAGTYYLRLLYDRFGYPGLFAAYNAGPARYEKYLAGAGPLPAETRGYLAQVSCGMKRSGDECPAVPVRPIDASPQHAMFIAIGGGALNGGDTAPGTGIGVDPMFAVRAVP